jgi:thymidylate synthase
MSSIQYQELDFNFLYKIEGFRYLSNINGLSLLDGTYLERLITAILKNKNLISDILKSTNLIDASKDRTEFGYKAIYGSMLKFNIEDGRLPLSTLRSIPFRWIVEELLWFLKGYTDNKILKSYNVSIWNGNTTNDAIKKRKLTYSEDIAGPIYGFQWRHWGGNYDEKDPDGARFIEKISNLIGIDQINNQWIGDQPFDPIAIKRISKGGIDQILRIIKDLINPSTRYSRRHIINGWNVGQLDAMVLPPCHVLYQFHVDYLDTLHCTFYQRSSDVALACSWNATSATILTNILAQLTCLKTGTLTMFIGNAHIYNNHLENAKKILNRNCYEFPKLEINNLREFVYNPHPKSELITDEMITSTVDNLISSQFVIKDYFSHPDLKFEMNA